VIIWQGRDQIKLKVTLKPTVEAVETCKIVIPVEGKKVFLEDRHVLVGLVDCRMLGVLTLHYLLCEDVHTSRQRHGLVKEGCLSLPRRSRLIFISHTSFKCPEFRAVLDITLHSDTEILRGLASNRGNDKHVWLGLLPDEHIEDASDLENLILKPVNERTFLVLCPNSMCLFLKGSELILIGVHWEHQIVSSIHRYSGHSWCKVKLKVFKIVILNRVVDKRPLSKLILYFYEIIKPFLNFFVSVVSMLASQGIKMINSYTFDIALLLV